MLLVSCFQDSVQLKTVVYIRTMRGCTGYLRIGCRIYLISPTLCMLYTLMRSRVARSYMLLSAQVRNCCDCCVHACAIARGPQQRHACDGRSGAVQTNPTGCSCSRIYSLIAFSLWNDIISCAFHLESEVFSLRGSDPDWVVHVFIIFVDATQ